MKKVRLIDKLNLIVDDNWNKSISTDNLNKILNEVEFEIEDEIGVFFINTYEIKLYKDEKS